MRQSRAQRTQAVRRDGGALQWPARRRPSAAAPLVTSIDAAVATVAAAAAAAAVAALAAAAMAAVWAKDDSRQERRAIERAPPPRSFLRVVSLHSQCARPICARVVQLSGAQYDHVERRKQRKQLCCPRYSRTRHERADSQRSHTAAAVCRSHCRRKRRKASQQRTLLDDTRAYRALSRSVVLRFRAVARRSRHDLH